MFAFIQPFGLSSPGGGPRILRSLLKGTSQPFMSICTGVDSPPKTRAGKEIHLPVRPNFYRLERSRLGKYLGAILPFYAESFKQRLEETLLQNQVSAIHAIPHGMEFAYAFEVAKKLGLPYYLNVHDELSYNLLGHVELPEAEKQLARIWREATGRMVISKAMGQEYSRRYGYRPYTVVTDGIDKLPSKIKPIPPKSLRVYFMGMVHLSYRDTFSSFTLALEQFAKAHPDWTVSFVIRGGLSFPLPKVQVPIEVLPWGTEEEVEKDFDRIDFLYLPLPFAEEHQSFSRYSLSTKMVTYLGSGLPIVYHGPQDAAAGTLLSNADAGVVLTSLDPDLMSKALYTSEQSLEKRVENALDLAQSQFMLSDVQAKFWTVLSSHIHSSQVNPMVSILSKQ